MTDIVIKKTSTQVETALDKKKRKITKESKNNAKKVSNLV
jgi:hypothetical protein